MKHDLPTEPRFDRSSASGSDRQAKKDSKVPWYRNSFGDTIPLPDMPPESVIDPPMEIPAELRPLGYRKRYLRTMQLLADPVLEVEADDEMERVVTTLSAHSTRRPLRHQNSKSMKSLVSTKRDRKLIKSTSHIDLVSDPRLSTRKLLNNVEEKQTSNEDSPAAKPSEQPPASTNTTNALPAKAITGKPKRAKARLKPVAIAAGMKLGPLRAVDADGDDTTARALRLRRCSQDPDSDLQGYRGYFGDTAKQQFYAQYKHLYSRPYLFMDRKIVIGADSEAVLTGVAPPTDQELDCDDSDDEHASTASAMVPVYPTSIVMRKMNEDLQPPRLVSRGSTMINTNENRPELPLLDKLSPRAQFLASCVAKPQLAVPVFIRKQHTKVFDFSFQSLGDEFISAFAKCLVHDLPLVEEISVRDNRLSDDGLNTLLQAVSEGSQLLTLNLCRLDISQNEIGPKSAQTLRSYLVSSTCTVEKLHVDNADIDDHECASFMTAFEKNQTIKQLWMSRNCIGKAENLNVVQPDFTTGGEAIANMLHVNPVLVHLDLSWNYLRLESSIALANSIRNNQTLVELKLSYNACADAGAMMFGEALRFNQTLEVLDLSYNSVGVKGAMVLANAIRSNSTLRSLQLNGNNIGREGGQLLMAALCANRTAVGCTIEMHACNLGSSMLSNNSSAPQLPTATASSNPADTRGLNQTPSNTEYNLQALPVFDAKTTRIFNPREPAGRYSLNLAEAYDKMIIMELVRLSTTRKGCRFLRMEYKSPTSAKRPITLIKKENLVVEQHKGAGGSRNAEVGGEETTLETRGLDALFANVDRDKSGYIDQDELMAVLNQIGLVPQMESLSSMLDQFDYNNSGFIEEGEFSAFLFHALFQMIDGDQSGKIDADEIEEAFKMLGINNYDDKEIADAIAAYDISGDGEMEEFEFVEFMKDRLLDRIKSKLLGQSDDDLGANDVPLVSLLDASTQKPWVIPEDGLLDIDFLYDREAFATNDEAFRQGKISRTGLDLLIRNITELATSKTERDDLFHVAMYDSEIRLTSVQAYQLLDTCEYLKPESKKIEMIALLLPQMLTAKEAQTLVARTLTLMQRCRLKSRMGSAYSVVLGNPTAHYVFDLAKHKDRIALNKLAEVAQSEKLFSKLRSGRADTSQHGNWENFRNEELDGHSIVLTNSFFHVLPRRGKLCFDYVSTTRPKRGTTPISDRRFDQLIDILQMDVVLPDALGALGPTRAQRERGVRQAKPVQPPPTSDDDEAEKATDPTHHTTVTQDEFWNKTRASILKRGWKFVVDHAYTFRLTGATKENVGLKMVQIESAICDRWLSCEQAAKIISCMPANFHARPETARILFSRVIDLPNFFRLYDAMSRNEQLVCARMLGLLNVMNPMAPERFYALNLAVHDEREMTKLLVDLAIGEPGENWLNQSFTLVIGEPGIPGWKLPARWEKEDNKEGGVNRAGFLELEYYSGQDRGCAPVLSLRKTLMKRVLSGTRLYCL